MNRLIKNDPRLANLDACELNSIRFGYLKFAISYFMYDCRKDLSNRYDPESTAYEFEGDGQETEFILHPAPPMQAECVVYLIQENEERTQIKENNNICHIPIIVLSAKASLDDRIAGLEQGIDDYITKPFSATYLKTRIASLLRQRKSLQEIYMAKLTEGKEIAVAEALTPSQPQITPYDEQFMQKVMEFIEEQMDNAELTIDEFAEHLMLSRTIFYRKLKSIIGLTPVDFIREVRIKRAAQLIDSGEYNFSQVAYMTGFNDPKYFSKCFKKVVGITPSEYKEKNK